MVVKEIVKKLTMILPDSLYIRLKYFQHFKKFPNLRNPKTFNEKLQWLKLHDRNPEYTKMVDKYAVREYIKEKIGEEYLIPLLGVWDSFDEIDFDSLPQQFVLKCTHDSGGLVICKDKSKLDIKSARKKINKSLKNNYYWQGREWPYKNVRPRIIAEKYMVDEETKRRTGIECLVDYKFFCFNGEPKIMYYSMDKAEDPRTDFFDMEYNHLKMRMKDPNSDEIPPKPQGFEEMKALARILSANTAHLRVDFYYVNGKIYAGELTFFHCGGFVEVKPPEWGDIMGNWIAL